MMDWANGESTVEALVIGQLIASLRERREMPQRELADAAEISQSTLSRIERGKAQIDTYTLRKVAGALGTTAAKLNEQVEIALERTEQAAHGVTTVDASKPWWVTALKVAGIVGLAGLAAFAVSAVLDEDKK